METYENEEELRKRLNDEYLRQEYEKFQKYYLNGEIEPRSVYNDILERSVGSVVLQVIRLYPVLRAAMEITENGRSRPSRISRKSWTMTPWMTRHASSGSKKSCASWRTSEAARAVMISKH